MATPGILSAEAPPPLPAVSVLNSLQICEKLTLEVSYFAQFLENCGMFEQLLGKEKWLNDVFISWLRYQEYHYYLPSTLDPLNSPSSIQKICG